MIVQNHESTAKPGKSMAPSSRERSRRSSASTSTSTVRPSPAHSGHMPAGSLNDSALAGHTLGSPARE
jgi:hypothetical protein